MLRGVSGLEILLLEGNEIAKIPSNIFEQAPNLRFIDLARNQIKRLQPTVFQGLKNLTLVDLEGNPLAPHVKDRIKQALSAEIDLLF
jgi:Leucine-rich repeat (LRR) protein